MSKEPGYNVVLRVKDKRFWVKFRTTTVQFGREEVSQIATTCIIREIGSLHTFSDTVVCNPNDRENVYDGCRFALKKVVTSNDFLCVFGHTKENVWVSPNSGLLTWAYSYRYEIKQAYSFKSLPDPDEIWDLFRKELWDRLGSKLIVPKE